MNARIRASPIITNEHRHVIRRGHACTVLPWGSVNRNVVPGPERPGTAQPDATRLEEHGEREIRAVRLLREVSAQIPYLTAHRRESAVAAWFGISWVLSVPESPRFVSTSQLNA